MLLAGCGLPLILFATCATIGALVDGLDEFGDPEIRVRCVGDRQLILTNLTQKPLIDVSGRAKWSTYAHAEFFLVTRETLENPDPKFVQYVPLNPGQNISITLEPKLHEFEGQPERATVPRPTAETAPDDAMRLNMMRRTQQDFLYLEFRERLAGYRRDQREAVARPPTEVEVWVGEKRTKSRCDERR